MQALYLIWDQYPLIIYAVTFFFGMCLGSFASALSYRMPRGLPWAFETAAKGKGWQAVRSMCPACETTLRSRDLVPVFSWLLSGRRCRHCGSVISARYPAQEVGAGVIACLLLYILQPHFKLALSLMISTPFLMAFCISLCGYKKWVISPLIIILFINIIVLTLL